MRTSRVIATLAFATVFWAGATTAALADDVPPVVEPPVVVEPPAPPPAPPVVVPPPPPVVVDPPAPPPVTEVPAPSPSGPVDPFANIGPNCRNGFCMTAEEAASYDYYTSGAHLTNVIAQYGDAVNRYRAAHPGVQMINIVDGVVTDEHGNVLDLGELTGDTATAASIAEVAAPAPMIAVFDDELSEPSASAILASATVSAARTDAPPSTNDPSALLLTSAGLLAFAAIRGLRGLRLRLPLRLP